MEWNGSGGVNAIIVADGRDGIFPFFFFSGKIIKMVVDLSSLLSLLVHGIFVPPRE